MNCYAMPYGPAPRRTSRAVRVGTVTIGGDAPIVVQSMTNTDTADCNATVQQVAELARAGSELVRITVNNAEAAAQVPHIRERLDRMGIADRRPDRTLTTRDRRHRWTTPVSIRSPGCSPSAERAGPPSPAALPPLPPPRCSPSPAAPRTPRRPWRRPPPTRAIPIPAPTMPSPIPSSCSSSHSRPAPGPPAGDQGAGAEPPGGAFRQLDLRADLEPGVRGPRADHGHGDGGGRGAGLVLRRAGGRGTARLGRGLGVLGISLGATCAVAVAVYGILTYLGER